MIKKVQDTDDPAESRFDRTNAFIKIMAIQAHPRFQSERIARAQSDEQNLWPVRYFLGQSHRMLWRDGYLDAY